jgi:hypothetical protein
MACATSSARAGALHGHQVGHLVAHAVGQAARGMDLGLDHAPGARVDADALGGHLLGQAHGDQVSIAPLAAA